MSRQELAAEFDVDDLKVIASQAGSLLNKARASAGMQPQTVDTK